ncbi:MAG TPA: hypothetical protein VF158_01745 [Longimicrobiales bacterium]
MKTPIALPLACCAVLLLAPGRLAAQLPSSLSLEARLGGAFATGEFGAPGTALDAGTGYAASVAGRLEVAPGITVYVGYERAELACAACADVAIDDAVIDAGIAGGAIVMLPFDAAGISPWLRAGVVRRQLEFSAEAGTSASKPGYGFDLGAGVTLPLVGPFTLTPGIRYLSYPAEFDFENVPDRSIDVTHVGVDVGLAYQF